MTLRKRGKKQSLVQRLMLVLIGGNPWFVAKDVGDTLGLSAEVGIE